MECTEATIPTGTPPLLQYVCQHQITSYASQVQIGKAQNAPDKGCINLMRINMVQQIRCRSCTQQGVEYTSTLRDRSIETSANTCGFRNRWSNTKSGANSLI